MHEPAKRILDPSRTGRPATQPTDKLASSRSAPGTTHSPYRDEKKTQWIDSAKAVAKEFGPVYPPEMAGVLQGLHALGLTPMRLVAGQEPPLKIPLVEVGEPASPFTIRFEGQRAIFEQLLGAVKVPLKFRLTHIGQLGLNGVSEDALTRIGFPQIKNGYPHFFSELKRAYTDSEQRAQMLSSCCPTADEAARHRRNIGVTARLRGYVDAFEKSHLARPGVPLRIDGSDGEPARIVIGNQNETDPQIRELHRFHSRESLFAERRYMLSQFGEFLRHRFFIGG